MDEAIRADGGVCAAWWTGWPEWYVRMGGWPVRFSPAKGWRGWWRRGDAGGPLLGHVTPPLVTFRVRDAFPVITAQRGSVTFVRPGS
jgi:hypothetical protein